MNDADIAALLDDLADAGLTLATAESLTGGRVCARLVDVPGASRVVLGGVCAYATRLKHEILGVDQERLERFGPVDEVVSLEMARGVRCLTGASIGVSTTGVAGPEPQGEASVGTVHVAVAWEGGDAHRLLALDGDRETIRSGAVDAALALVREVLDAREIPAGQ